MNSFLVLITVVWGLSTIVVPHALAAPVTVALSLKEFANGGAVSSDESSHPKLIIRTCVNQIKLSFDRPIRLATLKGRVITENELGSRRAFAFVSADRSFRRFIFQMAHDKVCRRENLRSKFKVLGGVQSVGKLILPNDLSAPLPWSVTTRREVDRESSRRSSYRGRRHLVQRSNPPLFHDLSGSFKTEPRWQAFNKRQPSSKQIKFLVNARTLNAALLKVRKWEELERLKNPINISRALQKLPLSSILAPAAPTHRQFHYGSPDLIYVLRRAAVFLSALYPSLEAIPVGDLSSSKGDTPSIDGVVLHPVGSHVRGRDADITYLKRREVADRTVADRTVANRTVANRTVARTIAAKAIDFEKNFWLLFGLLQSTGTDYVISAYRQNFIAYAQEGLRLGLFNEHVAGRFNLITADRSGNHDRHMHIAVDNFNNRHQSRRLMLSDDVFNCFLNLKVGRRGGRHNFCGDPFQ